MTTPRFQMPELANSAGNQVNANTTFGILDIAVQLTVLDKDLSTAPSSPEDGDVYIVASGNWGTDSSKAGQVAYWRDSANAWQFIVPFVGISARVLDELDSLGVPKVYSWNGSSWVQPEVTATAAPSEVFEVTGTTRTLGLTDAGKYLRWTNSSSKTVTVAPQADVAWPSSTEVHMRNAAASDLTIAAGVGVTVNLPSGGTLAIPNGGTVTLKRAASNIWDVIGQTVPA